MHILWLPSWFPTIAKPINGIFFKEQAAALAKQSDFTLRILYPDIRRLRELNFSTFLQNRFHFAEAKDGELEILTYHGWNLYPKWMRMQAQTFIRLSLNLFEKYRVKFGKPDLIHAQSSLWGGLAAKKISEIHSIPYLVTEHFSGFVKGIALSPIEKCWTTPLLKDLFSKAEKILSVSNDLNRAMKNYLPDKGYKFEVLPNCVDTDFFKPVQDKPKGAFHWIAVCGLIERKNLFFLLKCFKKVIKIKPDASLSIYGEGPLKQRLQSEIKALGLENKIMLHGAKSRLQIKEALSKSHAFVLVSKIESFGVVYIEALASGLPVVATNKGGAKDIVTNSNGYLVDIEDEKPLVDAMVACQDNYHRFIANNLAEEAKKRFGTHSFALRHKQIYQKILQ